MMIRQERTEPLFNSAGTVLKGLLMFLKGISVVDTEREKQH